MIFLGPTLSVGASEGSEAARSPGHPKLLVERGRGVNVGGHIFP